MCVEIDSDISIVFSTDIFNYTQQILEQFAHFEPSFDRKFFGNLRKKTNSVVSRLYYSGVSFFILMLTAFRTYSSEKENEKSHFL